MDAASIISNIIAFSQNPDGILKVILVIILILFLLFTLILGRQISLLINLVDQVSFSPVFKFIAYSLSGATIILLILVILV